MSVATPEPTATLDMSMTPRRGRRISRLSRSLKKLIVTASRLALGVLLCFHPLTAIVAVGWCFRLMRRQIWAAWWREAETRGRPIAELDAFLTTLDPSIPLGRTPRWIVAEHFAATVSRPAGDGRPPGRTRRLLRIPRASLGGFGANLRDGLRALACTYVLTLPGCFLWLAAWYDGWNNSFTKGYEQAAVGPLTGVLGTVLFIAAMIYVPMAWAHLAASGRAWAFFQFGFVWTLIRRNLTSVVIHAAIFSLLALPVSVLRVAPAFFTNFDPSLASAGPERITQVANGYILGSGAVVFVAFVIVHLLACRLYRRALLSLVETEPWRVNDLPPLLRDGLDRLGLRPEPSTGRRHPLVAVVIGTGRTVMRPVLWVTLALLWFSVVAQVFVGEFLNHHPVIGWLNQPLVHLPSLHFVPSGL